MELDGSFGNEQCRRDFLVALAGCDQAKDFSLSRGKRLFVQAGSQIRGGQWRDPGLSFVDCSNAAQQFIARRILQKIGSSPCSQRSVDVFIAIVGCQDDGANAGNVRAYGC